MGCNAAVQILRQADELKARLEKNCDLLKDNEAWTTLQKLQTIYNQAIILDLEYALDKKVEQDLWNIGFKSRITVLQELAKEKKNSRRSDYQALLTWFLETSSGFYLSLLQELLNSYDIDLPFRKRGTIYGHMNSSSEQINLPQTSSCLYICQYCLVHLGDIARYRNQRKQAESFYKQAIIVSPTSGHPYNQLALLEASQNDKLSTVFYYVRAIAVKNPFPASSANLLSILSSVIDKERYTENIPNKMTVSEFLQLFLYTQGHLQTATDLVQAEVSVKSLISIMTALVATQSFTRDNLIKMTVINVYVLKHVVQSKTQDMNELTEDEKKVRELVLELIAGSLSAFLVPIHTLKMDESLLDYYALPAVKLLMYFIQQESHILKEPVFANRLQIWPSLCKLLNNVQKYLKTFKCDKYEKTPLPEDKMLHGFLPFVRKFKEFDFKEEFEDSKIEALIRIKRIVDFSLWLTNFDVDGKKLIVKNETNGTEIFDPVCIQPDPTIELLEEMRSFHIVEKPAEDIKKKNSDRKGGILKPQGSLEKAREEREFLTSTNSNPIIASKTDSVKIKRSKQNVALQSIYKKIEENKQVKFSMEEPNAEKSVKFEGVIQKPPPPPPTNQNPLRTQSFNQNHPAFPFPPPTKEFLTSMQNVPPPEQPVNFPFPSSDLLNISTVNPPPFQPMNPPPKPLFPQSSNFVRPGVPFPNSTFPNLQYPPPNMYNNWKREDNMPNWGNSNQSYQQPPQDYGLNYGNYPNNVPYIQQNPMMQKNDCIKTQNRPDSFNSSWDRFPRNTFMEGGHVNYDSNAQNISMRKAMLNEVNSSSGPFGGPSRVNNVPPPSHDQYMQNSPGYSLFDASSWSPNLASQLGNSKEPENPIGSRMPQQPLFGNAPQSLVQLLEQQSQFQKK